MTYIIYITIMFSDIVHEWLRVTRRMRRFPFWQLATWQIGALAPLRADFEASFDEVSFGPLWKDTPSDWPLNAIAAR